MSVLAFTPAGVRKSSFRFLYKNLFLVIAIIATFHITAASCKRTPAMYKLNSFRSIRLRLQLRLHTMSWNSIMIISSRNVSITIAITLFPQNFLKCYTHKFVQ